MLGISFAEPNRYTHLAPASVASVAAMTQVIDSDRDAEFVRKTSSPVAPSVQPGWQWRERLRAVVQKRAETQGYRLYKALYDKSDYPDPDARTIFLFKSSKSTNSEPLGLLVLTPEDYSALADLDWPVFEAEIDQRLFGPWAKGHGRDADSLVAFSDHVLKVASSLYALPRMNQNFQVSIQPPHGAMPLVVECGDLYLSLDHSIIERMLRQPAIERDLHIAKMIEQLEPEVSTYLRGRR
jgi:hypothetical protein